MPNCRHVCARGVGVWNHVCGEIIQYASYGIIQICSVLDLALESLISFVCQLLSN